MAGLKLTDVTGIDPSQIKRLKSREINNVDDLIDCNLYKLCVALRIDVISAKTLKSNAQKLLGNKNSKISLDELKASNKKLKKNKAKHKDKKRRKNYKPLKKLKMWE